MSKKKYTQNDLRRLMQEQKLKATKTSSSSVSTADKIDSPLAKYENGQLNCILCKSVVRSEAVWKVHINSKNHREKVAAAKELKERLLNNASQKNSTHNKRPAVVQIEHEFKRPEVPEKKFKADSSIANSENNAANNAVPTDFFDDKKNYFAVTLDKTSIKKDLVSIKRNQAGDETSKMEVEESEDDEKLPEGFFDDPVKDAKIRNIEYKDPIAEEWERFQREIKEETTHSVEIIAGEHEEAISERQIEEIDEQIQNWSRVLNMEKKKENVLSVKNQIRSNGMDLEQNSNSDDDEVELDNLTDWRAKRLKLKK